MSKLQDWGDSADYLGADNSFIDDYECRMLARDFQDAAAFARLIEYLTRPDIERVTPEKLRAIVLRELAFPEDFDKQWAAKEEA